MEGTPPQNTAVTKKKGHRGIKAHRGSEAPIKARQSSSMPRMFQALVLHESHGESIGELSYYMYSLPPFEPADAELATALAFTLKTAGTKMRRPRKRAGHATRYRGAGQPINLNQSIGAAVAEQQAQQLGKAYTMELTSAAKAARIVRNRQFAKTSLENVKGRIAGLAEQNAALAARDAELTARLDACLARAAARLQSGPC